MPGASPAVLVLRAWLQRRTQREKLDGQVPPQLPPPPPLPPPQQSPWPVGFRDGGFQSVKGFRSFEVDRSQGFGWVLPPCNQLAVHMFTDMITLLASRSLRATSGIEIRKVCAPWGRQRGQQREKLGGPPAPPQLPPPPQSTAAPSSSSSSSKQQQQQQQGCR